MRQPLCLNSALSYSSIGKADLFLSGVSVITAGEAQGHGVWINERFLDDLVVLGNAKPRGIRSRFGHPDMCYDAIGTELGMFKNFRRNGDQVLADVQFILTDSNKDMINHILEFAEKEPSAFGTSIVFEQKIKRDEDGNPILNKYDQEILDVEEVDGKKFIGIESFDAVDFVDSPAANPGGIYSKTEFSQKRAEVLTKYIARFLNDNPKIKNSIDFLNSLFQKEEPNMVVEKRKLSRFFGARMGESKIAGTESWLIYPNESPQVNDQAIVRDSAGSEVSAPSGEYILDNGLTVLITDGVITEVIEGMSADEPSDEATAEFRKARNEARALAQEVAELRKTISLQKEKETLLKELSAAKPSAEPVKVNAVTEKSPSGKKTEAYSAQNIMELSLLYYKAKRNEGEQFSDKLKITHKRGKQKEFSGWDLTNELARCIPYLDEIFYDEVVNDSFLSKMTNITASVPMGNVNAFDVYIPSFDIDPYNNLWKVDKDECNTFNPDLTVTPDQRLVHVLPISYEGEICALDVRNLWNGKIYVDNETIPAESIVMTMIMERLIHDLERIAIFGRTGTAGVINGIYNEIVIAKASACIPATQTLIQAAYTETNTIAQIEALADLIPPFMRSMTSLNAYTTTRIWEYYYRNYRNSYNFNYETKSREIIPDILRSRARWDPLITFEEQTSTNNGVLITPRENLVYVLEKSGAENDLDIWYERTERVIRLRWKNYFGVNFARCTQIVTNL